MAKNQKQELKCSGMDIPDYVFEPLARSLLPVIRDYYETEEGQAYLADWKERQHDISQSIEAA